jgi:glycosyltransferase involved in cell wall biosynthesis
VTPKVTVLLPVYNGGAHLPGAIDSVLAQTYRDFELLLIDDCSSDRSVGVIESYADPRIRLLRNERNLGQVPTLNRGLREARGEYVARLDQDDVALPERLERQVALLDSEPAVGLVGTWMDFVDDQGTVVWPLRDRLDDFAEFVYLILINALPIAHPTVMFRRQAVLDLGGYDETVRLAEDQDLWRRFALDRVEARILPHVLLRYRVHEGQQSRQSFDLQQEYNTKALEKFIGALSERAPARPVRLLLSGDFRFWREVTQEGARELVAALERLLEDAAEPLRLSPDEHAKLERLVRARVGFVSRRSWRQGVLPYWRHTGPLRAYGGVQNGTRARARAAGTLVAAPVLRVLYLAKTAARGRVSEH